MNYKLYRILLFLAFSFGPAIASFSQVPQVTYDDEKFKQWNSMENGGWDFSPGFYYYIFHKNYSGAELKFTPWPTIKFKEDKSNVKRTFVPRVAHIPAIMEDLEKTRLQLDTIHPLFIEEMERTADRNIDLVYSQYQDDFEKNQEVINECLSLSLQKSNGKLSEAVELIKCQNDILLDDINFIHRTGIGYEMENNKRQTCYEEVLERMESLKRTALNLYYYSTCHY